MNTSILTRSAIAVATLAIGSVALAAAPATADVPSGVTRQTVLGAAEENRFFGSSDRGDTRKLVESVCAIGSDTGRDYTVEPAQQPDGVDGVLVQAFVEGTGTTPSRTCTFAAFATIPTFSTMSGTATITGEEPQTSGRLVAAAAPSHTYTLSGDVYVTTPVDDIGIGDDAVANASGDISTTTAATTTSARVVTPKTTQQKRAARTTYDRRLASAKKSYAKAKDQAGSSSSKKAAAKKKFVAQRKAAKAAYLKACAGTLTIVTTETPTSSRTSFTFTTQARGPVLDNSEF